ncbi:MAG: diaminopimelate dehydrogenase [Dehalococcoidales bacterium]|nr:diaminopimelate dehydrogenase [Dehalococcoidales bacterium]
MIRVAIVGYGNLGKGVKAALEKNADMELTAVFSRRPAAVEGELPGVHVHSSERLTLPRDMKIDVAILCGGSKEDTPVQGPAFAKLFNTVDSFDTHAEIPAYFQKMDAIAKERGNVSVISAGWDPGIFSLERVYGDAFLPGSKAYTFWGIGVSQGHSDAARKVKGVLDARQYTIPINEAIQQVRAGKNPEFSKRQMHKRVVYIVAAEHADKEKIKQEICEMRNYYSDYNTEVVFITQDEMNKKHVVYPHGGFVLTSGVTGETNKAILEYRCQLDSNPEFTGSVLVACARAAFRLKQQGGKGAYTMLDIPPALLSPHSPEILRSKFM